MQPGSNQESCSCVTLCESKTLMWLSSTSRIFDHLIQLTSQDFMFFVWTLLRPMLTGVFLLLSGGTLCTSRSQF